MSSLNKKHPKGKSKRLHKYSPTVPEASIKDHWDPFEGEAVVCCPEGDFKKGVIGYVKKVFGEGSEHIRIQQRYLWEDVEQKPLSTPKYYVFVATRTPGYCEYLGHPVKEGDLYFIYPLRLAASEDPEGYLDLYASNSLEVGEHD